MVELYATPYLHIHYDEAKSILFIKWTGFTKSTEFESGIDKIMEMMLEKNVKKTLTDVSEHKVIGAREQEYASQKSSAFSRDYWEVKRAIVMPKDIFAKFGLKQVNRKIAEEVEQERALFDNIKEAQAWLDQD